MTASVNVIPSSKAPSPEPIPVFEPDWPDTPRSDGMYISNDKDRRTPHPSSVPRHIIRMVAETYHNKNDSGTRNFPLFPKLPPEPRLMVWRHSLPASRIVEVLYNADSGICWSRCLPPAALRATQESRNVALRYYKLYFATASSPGIVYFDMDVDQLYVGAGYFSPCLEDVEPSSMFLQALLPGDRAAIKHLIIDDEIDEYLNTKDHNPNAVDRYGLTSLESLMIVQKYGNFDFVLSRAEEQICEFRVWSICTNKQVLPWPLPEHGETMAIEKYISSMWADLEGLAKDEGDEFALVWVRRVSRKRLALDSTWKSRITFLDSTVRPFMHGCLYAKDGVVERSHDLEDNDPDEYDRLADILGDWAPDIEDPKLVYSVNHPCACPIGHNMNYFGQRDNLGHMTLDYFKAALARLDCVGSREARYKGGIWWVEMVV
ncbi:hypothetical protein DL98DRAFT_507825 [Cadophora sp. DSE1049]|nr:hypothetical protein DL98DRAFT_507825 [Cadophora sp. DSE1049]